MDGSHSSSGMVAPSITLPFPIHQQQQQPFQRTSRLSPGSPTTSIDSAWKVVGSPPRCPPLSHPPDQQRETDKRTNNSSLNNTINNNTAGPATAKATASEQALNNTRNNDNTPTSFNSLKQTSTDSYDSANMIQSSSTQTPVISAAAKASVDVPRENSQSSASTLSLSSLNSTTAFSHTTQHKLTHPLAASSAHIFSPHDLPSSSEPTSTPLLPPTRTLAQTPNTPSPTTQALSASTPTPSRLDELMGEPAPSLHVKTLPSIGLSKGSRPVQVSFGPSDSNNQQIRSSGKVEGLESPLSLSSFIWNSPVETQDSNDPIASLSANLGGMAIHNRNSDVSSKEDSFFPMSSSLNTDPFVPNQYRPSRSLSLSEPPGFSGGGFNNGVSSQHQHQRNSSMFPSQEEQESINSFRAPLATMEEEPEENFEPRVSRTRSYSTSATSVLSGRNYGSRSSLFSSEEHLDPFMSSSYTGSTNSTIDFSQQQDQPLFRTRKYSVGSTWPSISHHSMDHGRPSIAPPGHRRSVTSNSYVSPIWENPDTIPTQSIEDIERIERQRPLRRFSLAPSSGFQNYDRFLENEQFGGSSLLSGFSGRQFPDGEYSPQQRRHSDAGHSGPYVRPSIAPFNLASSLESLTSDGNDETHNWDLKEEYEHDGYQGGLSSNGHSLGKGLTLSQLSHHGSLYVVEFKAGRSDLFYVADNSGLTLKRGDLVMVEADRGKDLGKITNDSITPQDIQELQRQHAEAAVIASQQDNTRTPKEIHPKRIFRLAHTSEITQLVTKNQDEVKAMLVDRRKLTFYFRADHRIDFRELVRDLFKIYKTRIWMYAVNPTMSTPAAPVGPTQVASQPSPPRDLSPPSASPVSPLPLQPPSSYHATYNYLASPAAQQQTFQQHAQQRHHVHHSQQHQQPHLMQYPIGYHPHSAQMEELMAQMQTQYFSGQPQSFYHNNNFHHQDHGPLEGEPSQTQLCDRHHPLQPPYQLM
ncbi:hypothetical protein FBU30_005100 [Linnemannia zychae]|nr:hypothetical protein FBU30_005100 [Linnemannia zychae]